MTMKKFFSYKEDMKLCTVKYRVNYLTSVLVRNCCRIFRRQIHEVYQTFDFCLKKMVLEINCASVERHEVSEGMTE